MSEQEKPQGIDPELKKEIMGQEWDATEGKEGASAVLIGKKEEMPTLKEKLEQEGPVKDLETYIRLYKKIEVPREELDTDSLCKKLDIKDWKEIIGQCWDTRTATTYYIDQEGNIASFNSLSSELEEKIKSKSYLNKKEEFEGDLRKLGFTIMTPYSNIENALNSIILRNFRKKREEAEKKKKEGFNF